MRYQWGTWYAYGERIDEAKLRRQIDLIAHYLGDLGPWHVVVDAGWQDIGPEGSGDLRRASPEKFPSGLRALVDYAHARGVRVLLYLAPTYVHDGAVQGEWLALRREDAAWDDATQSVINSNFAVSPRIVLIPIHDPKIPIHSGRTSKVQVIKVAAFFMERMTGPAEVRGRFLKVRAPGAPCVDGQTSGFFTYNLSLIR